jgi:phage protein D
MPRAQYRLYFDNAPVEQERVDGFGEIRVDQAIGMAAEAEVRLPVGTDPGGVWSGQEEDFVQPFKRVRIEVKVGDADFVALIDGPIVANRFELKASPGQSLLPIIVHDDSVLLNREEKVAVFEDKEAHEIAEELITEHGLAAEVDATPSNGSALTRFVVQRHTNMQLLRDLARRHGMFAYVKPGPTPGASIGVFARPRTDPGDLPEILLLGPDRNVASFSAAFDALRPLTARAATIGYPGKETLTAEAQSADLAALGDEAVHDALGQSGTALMVRTREEQADIDAAAQAAVNLSTWAYSARGEVDVDRYAGVLTPYQVVSVAGVGGYLSGNYLVSRVTHRLSDAGYRQQFALVRNARSAGHGGGGIGIPGGVI